MFWKTLLSYALVACCVLAVVVGYLLWSRPHVSRYANRLLALLLFVYAYIDFVTVLVTTGAIRDVPHLFRTAAPLNYLIGPLIYLHVRASLYATTRFRGWYALLFLPALLNFAELVPFYAQPAAVKLARLEAIAAAPNSLFTIAEGWFPPHFHLVGYTFSTVFYTLLVARMLGRYRRRSEETLHRNPVYEKWLQTFVLVQLIANGVWLIEMPFLRNSPYANVSLNVTFVLAQLILCLYILQRPALLYGAYWLGVGGAPPGGASPGEASLSETGPVALEGPGPEAEPDSVALPSRESETLAAREISERDIQQKLHLLEDYMLRQQPYLRPRLSLADVSVETRIPPYLLSAILNRVLGIDFRDYVNAHRVRYLCTLLESDRYPHLTLEGISTQAGFSSKTTFYRAFQKHTGLTPAQYHANRSALR